MFKLKKDLKAGELMEVDLGNDLCEEVKGRWRPRKDQRYWGIREYGKICSLTNKYQEITTWMISQNNCFKTEEEAQAHHDKLVFIAEFEEFWEERKYKEGYAPKYYIATKLSGFSTVETIGSPQINCYYFGSRDTAQEAIDKFGDKLKMLIR